MTTITSDRPAARWTAPRSGREHQERSSQALPLLWLQRMFWRRELKKLDMAQMRDCGLDPEAVRRESGKPFWRA
jgi:uncharacterized protein YjiS (DUF1127 family)